MKETLVDKTATIFYPLVRHIYTESQWLSLQVHLQALSLKHRKQLITICRSCSEPIVDTSLYTRCLEVILLLKDPKYQYDLFVQLFSDPLLSGLVISLCISLPLSDIAIRETYSNMLAKEMLVMESSPLPSALNYSPFFGRYTEPIHPSVPPNPRQAATVHMLIDKWILSLEQKEYILPHMTSKLCSKQTQDEVRYRYPDYMTFEEEGATQPDLEYIYLTYGDKIAGGVCEVKQRWYTSGITPRTYYAAGSDAYHLSKYVRDALNSLCDFLPPTERFSRVNPHRIILSSPQAHALIYDLTSFTSNMHEQRHFLGCLSSYCSGRMVRIIDSVEGMVEVDLGVLLSEYNQMNVEPKYMSDRLLGKGVVLTHHVAGFLGVYGNLSSCTFLHGAIMSQLVSTFSQIGVAGDDGLVESDDDYTTFFVIRLLGLMEESKGYNTSECGNQLYLKRPIRQLGNRVFSQSFALYSMLEHLHDWDDHRFFNAPRTKRERLSSLSSSIIAYLRSLTRLVLTKDQKDMIFEFLVNVYHHASFPKEGHIPQIHTTYGSDQRVQSCVVPTLSLESIGNEPLEFTIKSLYQGIAVIPDKTLDSIPIDSDLLFAGSEFVCTGSTLLSYYRKLGFVELIQDEVVIVGEDGLLSLLKYYSNVRTHARYTVSVIRDVPMHLFI